MDRGLRLTQIVVGVICVTLVLSLFLLGMVGGGRPADQAPPDVVPSTQAPPTLGAGDRLPGALERPLGDVERFSSDVPLNPDRQLDLVTDEDPLGLPEGLGDARAYAEQAVRWSSCDGALCARVLAPLDWDDPAGPAVELALTKIPSADPQHGPLFVNPGGPGAGGTDFARQFEADHWPGYDIVGWDPRGTGASTHVVCGTVEETDALHDLDDTPDDGAEQQALLDGYRHYAAQCRDGSGILLDHLSTVDVVRDLDLLRHLLGAERLNFLGISYGTYLGAMYATLFPSSSGRLVLDGAVEITDAEPVPQIVGFERAFVHWADWCADQEACALHGTSSAELQQRIGDWLDALDDSPLDVGDRTLTEGLAATGIALFLYADDSAYRSLALVVQDAMDGRGEALLAAADQLNGRGPDRYETIAHAFPAMLCSDASDEGVAAVPALAKQGWEQAPMLGRHMGMSYQCETWSVEPLPLLRLDAKGADPILVVGSTGDSATPYEQAERMAGQLEPARLLTFDGPGHGAVTGPNACIGDAVGAFLGEGTLPDEGTVCE